MNNKDTLRENVREALTAYRDHVAHNLIFGEGDAEDNLVSKTQIESAMRILWMEN